jgi:hypothetical protein
MCSPYPELSGVRIDTLMSLSSQQIERYARQIIVPGVGGIAQERLLSSRLLLVGKAADLALVLGYMVGAGVGDIRLRLPRGEEPELNVLATRASQLNPEITVKPASESVSGVDLALLLGRGPEPALLVRQVFRVNIPVIFSRLDQPARIAMITARPLCVSCADTDLLGAPGPVGENAGFVAMVAATESFKLLSRICPIPAPTLLQFDGFACVARQLRSRQADVRCDCNRALD